MTLTGSATSLAANVDGGPRTATVEIERDAETVTWTDWGVQNNYEDGVSYEQRVVDIGRIVFDRTQYETVLRGAWRRCGENEPAHRGDRAGPERRRPTVRR
ncbi:MAG: hypothetical protein KY454_12905 [Actinobacteria bacterium]|nr:hypothetical protein [Actinomycetota bacterium]